MADSDVERAVYGGHAQTVKPALEVQDIGGVAWRIISPVFLTGQSLPRRGMKLLEKGCFEIPDLRGVC
jgi:hypothetical protein